MFPEVPAPQTHPLNCNAGEVWDFPLRYYEVISLSGQCCPQSVDMLFVEIFQTVSYTQSLPLWHTRSHRLFRDADTMLSAAGKSRKRYQRHNENVSASSEVRHESLTSAVAASVRRYTYPRPGAKLCIFGGWKWERIWECEFEKIWTEGGRTCERRREREGRVWWRGVETRV